LNIGTNPHYNCSKCNKSEISYKLYGMPVESALEQLKSFGLSVKIMGCVPPYADEKTYLFQCKRCKHQWFEYDEVEENFFEFLYETYPGLPSPKIIYESGFIILEQGESFSYLRLPNEKETELFWKKIDEFNVWSWKKEYTNNDVLDGFGWELKIKRKGKRKREIHGYNSYPKDEKIFNNFLACINDFTGWDFEI
jgi:hypothetical protein